MKVYGADICIDCRNFKAIQKNRGFEVEYIDITESTKNLREFLEMRDADPAFEPVKARHGIGIPLFVREDVQHRPIQTVRQHKNLPFFDRHLLQYTFFQADCKHLCTKKR